MRINRATPYQFSEHLCEVEALLDPIRYDRSIDDAERRRLISDVLATANARALSLHASRPQTTDNTVLQEPAWHRELARTG